MCIRIVFLVATLLWTGGLYAQKDKGKPSGKPKSASDTLNYFFGMLMHEQFVELDLEFNGNMVKAGLEDQKAGTTPYSLEDAKKWIQSSMQSARLKREKLASEKNLAEGKAFLAKNGERPEVTVLPNGLQYEILKEGTGPKPEVSNRILAHYEGTLVDGTVFDSSYDRGEPSEFPLNAMIEGWKTGVPLMQEGAIYKFYIPYYLAYEAYGRPPHIGPNAALIFKIELVKINPQK